MKPQRLEDLLSSPELNVSGPSVSEAKRHTNFALTFDKREGSSKCIRYYQKALERLVKCREEKLGEKVKKLLEEIENEVEERIIYFKLNASIPSSPSSTPFYGRSRAGSVVDSDLFPSSPVSPQKNQLSASTSIARNMRPTPKKFNSVNDFMDRFSKEEDLLFPKNTIPMANSSSEEVSGRMSLKSEEEKEKSFDDYSEGGSFLSDVSERLEKKEANPVVPLESLENSPALESNRENTSLGNNEKDGNVGSSSIDLGTLKLESKTTEDSSGNQNSEKEDLEKDNFLKIKEKEESKNENVTIEETVPLLKKESDDVMVPLEPQENLQGDVSEETKREERLALLVKTEEELKEIMKRMESIEVKSEVLKPLLVKTEEERNEIADCSDSKTSKDGQTSVVQSSWLQLVNDTLEKEDVVVENRKDSVDSLTLERTTMVERIRTSSVADEREALSLYSSMDSHNSDSKANFAKIIKIPRDFKLITSGSSPVNLHL
eukprot:TRINITY_DN2160_c0_g1_i9.p1 TRINITY_DN2160_c0_g1~~TRINITY_DN2160_c0_g1_i9.p1  ORF type:complete len:490 (+),score=191.49 TRINITY_DN2160_c0_g1_i9:181-1650(+)